MNWPPGILYLTRVLPYLLWPTLTTYIALRAARHALDIHTPTWLLVASVLLARPTLSIVQSRYKDYQDRTHAERLGAVLPPRRGKALSSMKAILDMILNGFPGDVLDVWAREHGNTFFVHKLTSRGIITIDPDVDKAMLATQFDSFGKGEEFTGQMDSLLGSGIFNVDGDLWKFHRVMTRPFFTRERISDFETYGRNCDLSLDLAKERLGQGEPVEFQDLVSRFTLDSATEFLFGQSVQSLAAGIPYPPTSSRKTPPSFASHPSNIFVEAFVGGQRLAVERTALGLEWPLKEFLKDTVAPFRVVMDGFTRPLMAKAISRWEQNQQNEDKQTEKEDDTNLLAHLVRYTQDPKILLDQLMNLLVAGRDTTADLLSFSMYMLSQHPDIEKRLREEILEKVGPNDPPTYASVKDMRYIRAFLNEVLRMYPPVPLNVRRSNRPVVVPSKVPGERPLYIPANISVLYGTINIQRRQDLWGPDALEFDPMRFLDSRVHKYLTPNPFIFSPFSAGPRVCVGQQFAYQEATFYLIRLLQRFKNFKLDDNHNISPPSSWKTSTEGTKSREKIHPLAYLTMFIKGGLWIHMDEI